MAYCDITDVQGKGTMAGRPFSPVSNPTQAEVQARIDYRALEIDSRLSVVGVTVPVDAMTSPLAYQLVSELNALGAAADAQRIVFMRTSPNESYSAGVLESTYKELLLMYAGDGKSTNPGNPTLLRDAVLSSSVPETMTKRLPWSGSMRAASSERGRDYDGRSY